MHNLLAIAIVFRKYPFDALLLFSPHIFFFSMPERPLTLAAPTTTVAIWENTRYTFMSRNGGVGSVGEACPTVPLVYAR